MVISFLKRKLIMIFLIILIIVGITGFWQYNKYRTDRNLKNIQSAQNLKAKEITIRIIEGWSNKKIAEYLEKLEIVNSADFLKSITTFDASPYKIIPSEAKGGLQGFLYPDSYRLFKSISDRTNTTPVQASKTIIAKLLETFQKRLPDNAPELAKKQGLTLYEAVILASIIENETGRNAVSTESKTKLDEERRTVAGIFYNRLRSKLALQSDATINYITGKGDPAPTIQDTQIKSPYNTYLNRGLPPSPIGNPSLSSINAVLNPTDTEYFYFLHKQPSGEPVYSKTFEEHVANKQRYLK